MINGITDSNQKIVANSLNYNVDAAQLRSYPTSGTVWTDLSGNGNTSTLINGPTFNSANGGSIVFDGTNDYVSASDSSSLRPTSFSIDVWFRITSIKAFMGLVTKPFNGPPWTSPFLSYMIRLNASATILECSLNTGGTYRFIPTTFTFATNTIYNITFTYNSSSGAITIFINNSLVNSATTTAGAISYSSAPLLIGATYGSSPVGDLFLGRIYTVKIYNTVLSSTEISQNYNAIKSRFGL